MTITSTVNLKEALGSLQAELDVTLERAAKITRAIESIRALDAPKDSDAAPAAARTGAGPSTATRPAPPPAKPKKKPAPKPNRRIPCSVDGCEKTFTRQQGLTRHLNETHGLNRDGTPKTAPPAPAIPVMETTDQAPATELPKKRRSIGVTGDPLASPPADGYECKCGESFTSRAQLAGHRRQNNHYGAAA